MNAAEKQSGRSKTVSDEYEGKIKDRNRQLDSIKTALELGKSKLADLKIREGSSVAQLGQIDINLTTTTNYVFALSHAIDTLGVHIGILSDSVHSAEQRLAKRQEIMKVRLRTMYQNSGYPHFEEKSIFDLLTRSTSVTDLFNRVRYFNDLAAYDQAMLFAIDSSRRDIVARKDSVSHRKKTLDGYKVVKVAHQQSLVEQKKGREKLIVNIRAEKDAYLASIAQLEMAEKQIGALVTQLLRKRASVKQNIQTVKKKTEVVEKVSPARLLAWPVSGTVIEEFGKKVHPVYNTITMNNGIDIKASAGAIVGAAGAGVVAYVGSMRGLGNFVMIDHSDVITIYAHLDKIEVERDAKVTAHQSMGTLSASGILHFEVRRSTDALNPRGWLP